MNQGYVELNNLIKDKQLTDKVAFWSCLRQ